MEPTINTPEAVPTQPSQTATPTPAKKDYSLMTILSVLLILATLIAAFLVYQNQKLVRELKKFQANETALSPSPTPTPDPTANWKTYSDVINSYSFKYPSNLEIDDYSEGIYKGVMVFYNGPGQVRTRSELIDGFTIKTLLLKDIDQALNAYTEERRQKEMQVPEGDIKPSVSPLTTLTVGGKEAYQYSVSGVGNATVTYIKLDGNILQITGLYAGTEDSKFEYLKTITQILSTFKFTD